MSKRKKRREGAPLPATGAGLLRFFEEETHGVRIRPELVVVLVVTLISVCILAQFYFTTLGP